MIRDIKRWREWEDAYIASTPPYYARNLELLEAMYQEARSLGLFPLANPLKGLDVKEHSAHVINLKVLQAIAADLDWRTIAYMIIGGQALLLYGEPQLTKDVDVTLGGRYRAYP